MDAILRPEYLLLLLLEQGDRSFEGHTRLFLMLANTTSYLNNTLCALCDASLNPVYRALLSEDGPQEVFTAFVDTGEAQILFHRHAQATISPLPEPTADKEPESTATDEPPPHRATEPWIAAEPELLVMSVQVCEPATMPTTREKAVASDIVEGISAHCNVAEELSPDEAHKCLPSHPLLPPPPPLSSGSPSAHYQSSILSIWLEDPLSPPPASESRTPPRPIDPVATLWLLVSTSPPWSGSRLASPGSLVPLDLPWAVAVHPAPRDFTPPALPRPSGSVRLLHPSGSTLVLCRSSSTAASRIHASASVTGAICSTSTLQILLVTLAHWLSVSTSGSPATCSTTVGQLPGVISPSSSMASLSVGSTVGRHQGCGLGPTLLLLLQVPPPSCRLPGSSLCRLHSDLCSPSSSWMPVLLLSLLPRFHLCLPLWSLLFTA
ncbi:RNA-binding protein Hfq [Labeo rohita]|uniref:RNA-binding protein Hfq n=1 Tax=Labeo rohita TaxID=84645 RepID=A0ABQ8MB23_LABRO|nr:RNA-binding protein Hfq [Labeo rohita]